MRLPMHGGILMVHTFNEGEEHPNGKTKQWVVTPTDGQPVAIASGWEITLNGAAVPLWASSVASVVAGALARWRL
jgi:hypothetical protein